MTTPDPEALDAIYTAHHAGAYQGLEAIAHLRDAGLTDRQALDVLTAPWRPSEWLAESTQGGVR